MNVPHGRNKQAALVGDRNGRCGMSLLENTGTSEIFLLDFLFTNITKYKRLDKNFGRTTRRCRGEWETTTPKRITAIFQLKQTLSRFRHRESLSKE